MRVADEFGFQVAAFHHALEAYKIPYIFTPQNITIATFAYVSISTYLLS